MSGAPLVLSAAVLFCVSSFLALADEKGAIVMQSAEALRSKNSAAKQQQHHYHAYRRYRGYDEGPAVGA
jgi:hypothetical protein